GWRPSFAGWNLDLGGIEYTYINQPDNADYNYFEFKAGASRTFGQTTIGGTVYYSPDFTGGFDAATYAEGNIAYAIDKFTLSAAYGHQWIDPSAAEYSTWNAGVSYAIAKDVSIDGRYYDTDAHSFGKVFKSRGVVALKVMF